MISELSIKNFKAFADEQTAKLAPLTLIFGPNGAGKSSLIQTLMVLRQSSEAGEFVARGPHADVGSFRSCVWGHDTRRRIRMRILFDKAVQSEGGLWDQGIAHEVSVEFGTGGRPDAVTDGVALERASCQVAGTRPVVLRRRKAGYSLSTQAAAAWARNWFQSMNHPGVEEKAVEALSLLLRAVPLAVSAPGMLPKPSIDYLVDVVSRWRFGQPAQKESTVTALTDLLRMVHSIADAFAEALSAISHVGPLRARPLRGYFGEPTVPDDVGFDGANAVLMLARRAQARDLTGYVSGWFERLEIPYALSLSKHTDEVLGDLIVPALVDGRTGVSVSMADVGFGVSQVLPIIVQGIENEGTVCVEQPELHLHPRLQAHLADFFLQTAGCVDHAIDTTPEHFTQWVIETHSEAMMLRVQKRIREGKVEPGYVSVLYVSPGADGSSVRRLRLGEDGEFLDEWPGGFFEDRFSDVF